jgi:Spy/CpxP family protein refolding chaperone
MAIPGDVATGAAMRGVLAMSIALLIAAAALTAAGMAGAATYKWVDEKGVVHYSDKVPPEAVDKANVELNKQGIPVKKTDKALTPEQRRAIEQDAERQKQTTRQQEEAARRDRALLSSYTSEAEIDLARNRSLQTINNVVQSTFAYSEQLTKRRAEAEQKKIELAGKPIVASVEREIESIDAELVRQSDLIALKKRETEQVTAKYDADKQRWRELVAAKSVAEPGKAAAAAAPVPAAGTSRK